MTKHLLIRKQNNRVESYSDGLIGFDDSVFQLVPVDISQSDMDKLKQNIHAEYRGDALQFSQAKTKTQTTEDLKDKLAKAKDLEGIKAVVEQLLNN